MKTLLSGLGVLAALVFIAASASMNFVFLSSLGKTELEGHIFGAVSVAVDILKALLPLFISWAVLGKKPVFALIASVVFCLFFGFSLLSAVGFAAGNRGAVTGDKQVITARYEAARRDLGEAETRFKALPTARPQGVIAEALRALEQDRRWTSSKSCTDATAGDSRIYCEGYFKTKAELAAAMEGGRLEERVTTLKQEIGKLAAAGAGQDADAQASVVARLTGVGVSSVQMGMVLFVALLVEIGAAFGLYLATGHGFAGTTQPVPRAPSNVTVLPRRDDVIEAEVIEGGPRRLRLGNRNLTAV